MAAYASACSGGSSGSGSGSGSGSASAPGTVPVTPACAAACSTWSSTCWICSADGAPWNSGRGWPWITATAQGTPCTPKAWVISGWVSASRRARTKRPRAATAACSSDGVICSPAAVRLAPIATITGTVALDSTTCWKFSGDRSTMTPAGACRAAAWEFAAAASWAGVGFWSIERSTAPRGSKWGWLMGPSR